MSNELKPCPFCNSKAEMHFDKLAGKTIYMVKCSVRECQCQEMGWHESESKAASAWNSRPIEDKLQSEIDKLNKALDMACGMIGYSTISCPHIEHGYQCESCICIGLSKDKMCEVESQCWKEYYIKKAGE